MTETYISKELLNLEIFRVILEKGLEKFMKTFKEIMILANLFITFIVFIILFNIGDKKALINAIIILGIITTSYFALYIHFEKIAYTRLKNRESFY